MTAIIVLSKRPTPGLSKTRLSPPCTTEEAAAIASASLRDTLDAVSQADVERRVLVMEGDPTGWRPDGFEVLGQRGDGLDERLAAAFDDVGGPSFLVGMDTPQLTPVLLDTCAKALGHHGSGDDSRPTDEKRAILGLADDGGWWSIGLPDPDPDLFIGVPMSTPQTGARQQERLETRGYRVDLLPVLRDVDEWSDALQVASEVPGTRFARAVHVTSARVDRIILT